MPVPAWRYIGGCRGSLLLKLFDFSGAKNRCLAAAGKWVCRPASRDRPPGRPPRRAHPGRRPRSVAARSLRPDWETAARASAPAAPRSPHRSARGVPAPAGCRRRAWQRPPRCSSPARRRAAGAAHPGPRRRSDPRCRAAAHGSCAARWCRRRQNTAPVADRGGRGRAGRSRSPAAPRSPRGCGQKPACDAGNRPAWPWNCR